MEKKYLKELTNIITTTLDAHKMAEWDNKSARDVIAGVMEDQLSIFKPIKDGEK